MDKSSGSWTDAPELYQIKGLIKEWQGCDFQIKFGEGYKEIGGVTNEEVTGLFEIIKNKKNECESLLTPKKEIIFHKPTNGSWEVYLDDAQQVNKWIESKENFKSKKCVLKVFNTFGNKDISGSLDLTGLPSFLTTGTTVESACSTPGTEGNPKKIVLKKEGEESSANWKIMTEKEQIKELMKTLEGKCTLKIKETEGSSTTDKDIDDAKNVEGLYDELIKIKDSSCIENGSKQLTFQKESGGSWKKI